MNIKGAIEKAERAAGMHEPPSPRRRVLELIAEGTRRLKRRPAFDLARASDAALLAVIGTDAEGFDKAIRGFGQWWRSGGREEMKARGYNVSHFNL